MLAAALHYKGEAMLVLARGVNESVQLQLPDGTMITVTLLTIEKSQCKIGFDAPKDVIILRDDAKTLIMRKLT